MEPLPTYVNDFLEYLEIERNVSKLTIRNYGHYLHRLMAFMVGLPAPVPFSPGKDASLADSDALNAENTQQLEGEKEIRAREYKKKLAALTPEDITAEKVHQYRLYLSRHVDEHGMSLKRVTQNYHLIALRSFLKYLLKRDIPVLAPEKIDLPKADSHSIKFLEREQVERLMNMPEISKAEGLRDKAIMEVLFSTGLRVSELVSLNRDQINLERQEFGVIGKGRRPRVVFLSQNATDWLKRYIESRDDESPALFIRYSGKKPEEDDKASKEMRLTARSVQRMVEKYVKKARLPIKITPHGLRHSFATDLLTGGADLRAIQEMLGHKNVSTTQIYTHITNPQLKEIHNKFHRR
jgi:site-specific recombinase XerD